MPKRKHTKKNNQLPHQQSDTYLRLSTALLAAPKDGEGMTFNGKFRLVCDGSKLVVGKTDIHFDHTMAYRTGQVMMMLVTADAVVVCAIGKFDTIQDTHISEFLHGAEDGCSS